MRYQAFASRGLRTSQAVSGRLGRGLAKQGSSGTSTDARPHSTPPGSDGTVGWSNLATGLTHDIRNPLTAIKTFASVLRARKDQPDFLARFERGVAEGVARIEALLDDLADLANPDRPYDPAGESLEAVDLPSLLSRCLDDLGEELAVRSITREQSVQAGLPPAQGHAARLRKAFMFLLRFFCQNAGSGGTITMRVERGADGCLVTHLAGGGLGIAAEHLPHVFEPYFSTGKGRDAGLSLALARKIVHEHGGEITAFSRPGQGVTFRVLLQAWR